MEIYSPHVAQDCLCDVAVEVNRSSSGFPSFN